MAALIAIKASAIKVSLVVLLHVIALETIIEPVPAKGPPLCVEVLIKTFVPPAKRV
jgi:hypothetical protein